MLTSKQRAFLKARAHNLDPRVMVGKEGASDALKRALETQLDNDELVKLRFVSGKETCRETAQTLARASGRELVQCIGYVAVLYRPSRIPEKRNLVLP